MWTAGRRRVKTERRRGAGSLFGGLRQGVATRLVGLGRGAQGGVNQCIGARHAGLVEQKKKINFVSLENVCNFAPLFEREKAVLF